MAKKSKAQRRPKTRERIRRDRQTAEALGRAHEQLGAGRLQGCVQICRSILARTPEEPEALFLLGLAAAHSGHREPAIEYLYQAIALDPSQAHYFDTLGVIQLQLKSFADAEAALQQAIRLDPKLVSAHNNLGCVYREQGDLEGARRCFENTLSFRPTDLDVRNNLGVVLLSLGQAERAIGCFEKVLEKRPGQAETLRNLGVARLRAGRLEEAEAPLRESLAIDPDSVKAHKYLATVYTRRSDFTHAAEQFAKAVALNEEEDSLSNLGGTLLELRRYQEAFATLDELLSTVHPLQPKSISNFLFMLNYLPDMDPAEVYRLHARWGAELSASVAKQPPVLETLERTDGPMRIGYLSSDFREHSVRYFMEPLLAAHDPQRVTVYCYANLANPDEVTERLRSMVGHWRDIYGMSDQAAVEQIRSDGIQVLVDLGGHTGKNRLPLFAARPAPIQASYLGYPNTTGLPEMDYRITDELADPPGLTEVWHLERLARVPGCFLCYRPNDETPAPGPPPLQQSGRVTFGSFNNLTKVNDPLLGLWAEILLAVPGSRLLLKSDQLADAGIREVLLERLRVEGIDEDRVELRPRIESKAGHLALYDEVDIALDSYPYNGTTTTFEALWMGVPVITLAGRVHASRVGASILAALEKPELIAENEAAYRDTAVALARDPGRIAAYRTALRRELAASPLLDGRRLASALEDLYADWVRERVSQPG